MPRALPACSFAALLPFAFCLAACSGATTGTSQAGTVGSSGGTVSASDGTAIDIPAGALKSTEEITLEETTVSTASASGVLTPVGTAYEIGPDTLAFSEPATITLLVDATKLSSLGDMMSDVSVFWTAPGESAWSALGATVKDATHVTVQTSHVGTFVAGVPLEQPIYCGPAQPVGESK